jgi:hypothetical protein
MFYQKLQANEDADIIVSSQARYVTTLDVTPGMYVVPKNVIGFQDGVEFDSKDIGLGLVNWAHF